MAELWVRMEDLFPNQWTSGNGFADLANHRFSTWCRKLANLSMEEFARGFDHLEQAKATAAQEKRPFFPPSYADFIGYTRPSNDATSAQQARQADTGVLKLTKKPTEEELAYGQKQGAALKGLFA